MHRQDCLEGLEYRAVAAMRPNGWSGGVLGTRVVSGAFELGFKNFSTIHIIILQLFSRRRTSGGLPKIQHQSPFLVFQPHQSPFLVF